MKPFRNSIESYLGISRAKYLLLCVLIYLFTENILGSAPPALREPGAASNPSFRLKLTLTEYSILNAAEVDGLQKYGGSGEFKVTMAKETNQVIWTVTIENPRLLELLAIFVGEKTVKIIQGLDPNNIDAGEKAAFKGIKSLSEKLEYAQKNPIWPLERVIGIVSEQDSNLIIHSDEETLKLTGTKGHELKSEISKSVVVSGFIKIPGEFEVTDYFVQKTNTLEIFVMSLCPYGRRAETNLLSYLERTVWDEQSVKPALEIHYIFNHSWENGRELFTALHGEAEIRENLVQIVMREKFPRSFFDYIRNRAADPDAESPILASRSGLSGADISEIERIVTNDRDSLIRKEFEYAVNRYDISDGSPSFTWESKKIKDPAEIKIFKGLAGGHDRACTN